MKTDLLAMTALFASCLLLTACNDDAGVLKISIDTPTTEASFSTTASELVIGGSASYGGSYGYGYKYIIEIYATNLRTGKRYEAVDTENLRWHVLIPDLQPGENEIVATALSVNDYSEARITILRTQ